MYKSELKGVTANLKMREISYIVKTESWPQKPTYDLTSFEKTIDDFGMQFTSKASRIGYYWIVSWALWRAFIELI